MSSDPLKILLEGPPRIGKSTLVSRLVELLRQAGQPVGGFITRELREDGHRVGFCVQDLVGPEAVLARQTLRTDVRVGRFYVDVAAFENVALPALASAARLRGVIVVDEIGRMELASSAFVDEVERLLDRPVPLVATIHVHEHTVTDRIKRRVDVELIEVTRDNRDDLPVELFRRFDVR